MTPPPSYPPPADPFPSSHGPSSHGPSSHGPSAPSHRAPPSGWRPMSGLAVTAFVLSLVSLVPAWLGLWVACAIPFLLGVVALFTVHPAERRGRGFAIAAIAISLPMGLFWYAAHNETRAQVRDMGAHVLAILRGDEEAKLVPWLDETAAKEGLAARLRERYAAVAKETGPYDGNVDLGSPWLGAMPMFMAPAGLQEVGPSASKPDGSDVPLGTLWVRAGFGKERLAVAFVLRGAGSPTSAAEALGALATKRPAAVVTDLRFFRTQ